MIDVDEALRIVLSTVRPLPAERCSTFEALHRALAEDVHSERNVPGYVNSAMDGYAVRGADLGDDTASVRLRVTGASAAGVVGSPGAIGPGEAMAITTGAPVPDGADTVVMVEDTDAGTDVVEVTRSPAPGANVRGFDEDVQIGTTVLAAGRTLRPADLGLLASVGKSWIRVGQRARVAILSTGNELIEPDRTPQPGQIVNSNAITLAAAVTEAGGEPFVLPIVPDDADATRRALEDAARADAILSSGGVSVGTHDHVKDVLEAMGVEKHFWKVAQKPGKPLFYGTLAGRPYFGLPGNPVSALVCFYVYARPALRAMMSHTAIHLPTRRVTVGEPMKKSPRFTDFLRCRFAEEPETLALTTGTQSSAVLTSMARADGLLVAPRGLERIEAGDSLRAILLGAGSAASIASPLPDINDSSGSSREAAPGIEPG